MTSPVPHKKEGGGARQGYPLGKFGLFWSGKHPEFPTGQPQQAAQFFVLQLDSGAAPVKAKPDPFPGGSIEGRHH